MKAHHKKYNLLGQTYNQGYNYIQKKEKLDSKALVEKIDCRKATEAIVIKKLSKDNQIRNLIFHKTLVIQKLKNDTFFIGKI